MKKSNAPTGICKICFKEFKLRHLRYFFSDYADVCPMCFKKFQPSFIKHKIDDVDVLSFYEYNDDMKSLIYQLKGCYDIVLAPLFIQYYAFYYHLRYRDYYIVPIPSYKTDNSLREFNHVEELFKPLNLPVLDILYKTEKYKQSDQKARDRHLISKYLEITDFNLVKDKKILIVDDICTTGSTLKAAINLIKRGKPKKIKILTIAITKPH